MFALVPNASPLSPARGGTGSVRPGLFVAGAALLALLAGRPAARADLPVYDFELQCRANFSGAYQLPNGAFFTSNTPALNDSGEVTIKISVISGSMSQGIWAGAGGLGGLIYISPADASLGQPSISAAHRIVFEQTYAAQVGLFYYDLDDGENGLLTTLPFGATGWGSPQVNVHGQVGYRAYFAGMYAWVSYDGVSSTAVHAAEVGLDPSSPYSYLFTPSFNDARQIAGKVRLGAAGQVGETQPDQIRIFESDGSSQLIAEDAESNPSSPFSRFDNSVALTNDGQVAFVARLVGGTVRGVYFSDGTNTVEIARSSTGPASNIESFGPAANDAGLVAFRALDAANMRAIWIGDGVDLGRLVSEHDLVPTDLGPARIDQHDTSPVFGGSITMNSRGDVTFNAGLTPPDNNQVEWGSGVFIAYARRPGDMNCDGAVNALDISPFVKAMTDQAGYYELFPMCNHLNGDINCDGTVNALDINPFVQCITGECPPCP